MPRLHTSDSWKKLEQLGEDTKLSTIEELFREDPSRGTQHSLELNGLYLDCSRNQIDKRIKSLLLSLCDQAHVSDQINAMFSGKKINISENRAVLHTALRSSEKTDPDGPLDDIRKSVHANLEQMQHLTDTFRSGKLFGATRSEERRGGKRVGPGGGGTIQRKNKN